MADSRYGNTANLIALAQGKIRAHVADLRSKMRNPRSQGIYSPAARSDRKRRQWFQERNFGEASVEHGFKRARWRGLWRQSIQAYLIAAIQNLRIIARRQKNLLFAFGRGLLGSDEPDHRVASLSFRSIHRISLPLNTSPPIPQLPTL